MHFFGSKWWDISLDDYDFSKVDHALKEKAVVFLQNIFKDKDLVVIKDPRICITLPFWQNIISKLKIDVQYVYMYRHPGSVASSLNKRDGIQHEYGELMWFYYNLTALTSMNADFFSVDYDMLVQNSDEILNVLSLYLTEKKFKQKNIIEKRLQHHAIKEDENSNNSVIANFYYNMKNSFDGLTLKSDCDELMGNVSVYQEYLTKHTYPIFHTRILVQELGRAVSNENFEAILKSWGDGDMTYYVQQNSVIDKVLFVLDAKDCTLKVNSISILNMADDACAYKTESSAQIVKKNQFTFINCSNPHVAFEIAPQKLKTVSITFELHKVSPKMINRHAKVKRSTERYFPHRKSIIYRLCRKLRQTKYHV